MIFKQCTTLILTFLLLVSNSGLALNVHYCGEKIASVSLKLNQKPNDLERGCCGIIEKKTSCCDDKIVQLQENSDKFQKEISQLEFSEMFLIDSYKTIISKNTKTFSIVKTIISYSFNDHLPPIFKLNCQLVFYA